MNVQNAGFYLALVVVGSTSFAQAEEMTIPGEFSATVVVVSDYANRGISLSNGDVAMQSSIDWSHDSGAYLGVSGSNVDFGNGTHFEMSVYGGHAGEVSAVTYDVMILGYLYPGTKTGSQDFMEFSLALGYDAGFAAVSAGVAVSPEFYLRSGVGTHIGAGLAVPVPLGYTADRGIDLRVDANFGVQILENFPDYVYYNAGLGLEVFDFKVDVRYVGTGYTGGSGFGLIDDDRVVFGISREF